MLPLIRGRTKKIWPPRSSSYLIADITFSLLYAERWVLIGTRSGGGVEIKLREKERYKMNEVLQTVKG